MMARRTLAILLTAALLCVLAATAFAADSQASAKASPGKQARALRQGSDLTPFAPPWEVLQAYFIADENAPKNIYGPVSAYATARACPTAWLMEKGELARVERLKAQKDVPPFEFSLTLEEDCGSTVTHAVFVASPGSTPEAWLKWRSQFHGRKAEAHYGAALAGLKKAEAAGFGPTAELRFVSINGELVTQSLEDLLRQEGRLAPVFNLETGLRPGK